MVMLAHSNVQKVQFLIKNIWFAIGVEESNVKKLLNSSSTTKIFTPKSFQNQLFIYNFIFIYLFCLFLLVGLLCNLKSGILAIKDEIEKHYISFCTVNFVSEMVQAKHESGKKVLVYFDNQVQRKKNF